MLDETKKLELDISGLGQGKVILDGEDISHKVRALTIYVQQGRVPEVILDMPILQVTGSIEGIVRESDGHDD